MNEFLKEKLLKCFRKWQPYWKISLGNCLEKKTKTKHAFGSSNFFDSVIQQIFTESQEWLYNHLWDPVQNEMRNPLFKEQETKVLSFSLWPPSQPVIVFFICYSALCSFGRVRTHGESAEPHRRYDCAWLHMWAQESNQSLLVPAPKRVWWRGMGEEGQRWSLGGVGSIPREVGPGFQAPGVCSIVPLDFT